MILPFRHAQSQIRDEPQSKLGNRLIKAADEALAIADGKVEMTPELALVLLRSGQMELIDYFRLCDEHGWAP